LLLWDSYYLSFYYRYFTLGKREDDYWPILCRKSPHGDRRLAIPDPPQERPDVNCPIWMRAIYPMMALAYYLHTSIWSIVHHTPSYSVTSTLVLRVKFKVVRCGTDTVFWLIGANAPIMKVHFKCIKKIKNLDKIFRVCIWTYYVYPRKFWYEKTFFVSCIKKDKKKCYVNSNFVPLKNCLFYIGSKKYLFLTKLGDWT
jgi:hypothetical protein